jgi:uncharacterized protein
MKVVLDTNILISAFLAEGICARILHRARRGDFIFVLCHPVLMEFQEILKKKFEFEDSEISFFVDIVSEASREICAPGSLVSGVCRDKDDEIILACALEAGADFLVTGDSDLLVLEFFKKTKILAPRDFEMMFID